MISFAYDGSWMGFLSLLERAEALDAALSEDLLQVHISREGDTKLFQEDELVVSVEETARRMHRRLKERLGNREKWMFRHAQAAGKEAVDTLLVNFWLKGSDGITIDERYRLVQWASRVSFECHRYQGILRLFPLDNGVMYGPLSPDFMILPFLMQWAVDRFPDTPLILHDTSRNRFRWNFPERGSGEGTWLRLQKAAPELPNPEELLHREGERTSIEEQWRDYTKAISVKERKNSKQQRSYLPKKYRTWMPEFR